MAARYKDKVSNHIFSKANHAFFLVQNRLNLLNLNFWFLLFYFFFFNSHADDNILLLLLFLLLPLKILYSLHLPFKIIRMLFLIITYPDVLLPHLHLIDLTAESISFFSKENEFKVSTNTRNNFKNNPD